MIIQGVEYVSWEDLFSRSDVLSIHVLLSDLSRGWVTAKEFGLMKQTAFLINTSRGQVVNEKALIDLDHVVLSPHLGYSTGATLTQFYVASVENLQAWMHGSPIHVLNDAVLN